MAPKTTGGKPGERIAGIYYRKEKKYHRKPYQVRLFHGRKESSSYYATEEEAIAAKIKSDRLRRREGSHAFAYDRKAQYEYEEAKRILGPGVSLIDMARDAAARATNGVVAKTVTVAIEEYLQSKSFLRRSKKHLQDIRQRLRRFAQKFPERQLDSIRRDDVLGFLTGLGLGSRTFWNFFDLIRALFRHGVRADWCTKNPCDKVDLKADMPEKRRGLVEILTIPQAIAVMREIELREPLYIGWACIQYFFGVRDAESERFRGEWIERKKRRVVLPGWFVDGEEVEQVAKTKDDWVLDTIPPVFWRWVDRYPDTFSPGPMAYPSSPAWNRVRHAVIKQGHFAKWPRNGFRHSFATYHLSWLRDANATSFLLRHKSPKQLWDSYFAKFVPRAQGRRYLSLMPL